MNRPSRYSLMRWVVPPSSGQHWDLLDGLRGVAILLVVVCHGFYFNPDGPRWQVQLGQILGAGYIGVQVFFVLSGFLIAYPFLKARAKEPGAWIQHGYAARRALKIVPPLLLTILGLAVYYVLRYDDASYATLGAKWAVGIPHVVFTEKYFNTSFWSIWVEVGFYVALPFLFLATRGMTALRSARAIFAVLFVVPLVVRALTWQAGDDHVHNLFITARFPCSLTNFAWGVLFAGIWVGRVPSPADRKLARRGHVGLLLLLLALPLLAWATEQYGSTSRLLVELKILLPGVATFLALFLMFDPDCLCSRLLCNTALRYTGIISYEWFLLHQPAQFQFHEWFGRSGGSLPRYLCTVLVPSLLTLALAALIYNKFSLPLIRAGRRRIQGG